MSDSKKAYGRRAIALIDSDPKFQAIYQEHEAAINRIDERKKFLRAQAEQIEKDLDATKMDLHGKLEHELKERKLLPECYDTKRFHFHIGNGAVELCDEETADLPQFLAKMLGGSEPI